MCEEREPTEGEKAWIVEQRDLMVEKAQAANALVLPKPEQDADDEPSGRGKP
jgi:hypothetical protein